MDRSISAFIGTLSPFLSQIESASRSLAESVRQRPIPLDSAEEPFLRRLDACVSAAAADLERLESMAFGTVSFAELLGHCNEVYKLNQAYIGDLKEMLGSSGYVPGKAWWLWFHRTCQLLKSWCYFLPEAEVDCENNDFDLDLDLAASGNQLETVSRGSDSASEPVKNTIEMDIFDESLSLQNLGLSDICLATLASEDRGGSRSPELYLSSYANGENIESKKTQTSVDVRRVQEKQLPSVVASCKSGHHMQEETATRATIVVSKDDYDKIPSYMKSLASWEDTSQAVGKINSELRKKRDGLKESTSFSASELEKFELGHKGRSFLLLLLKMNKLVVEMEGGAVVYRVVVGG